jgi:hypothetical protein
MEEKYIITFENGSHSLALKITADDINGLNDGLLTIIRCSDAKELNLDGDWVDLEKWNN